MHTQYTVVVVERRNCCKLLYLRSRRRIRACDALVFRFFVLCFLTTLVALIHLNQQGISALLVNNSNYISKKTTIHIKTSNSDLRLVVVCKRPHNILQTSNLDALLNTPSSLIILNNRNLNKKYHSWASSNSNHAGCTLFRYASLVITVSVILKSLKNVLNISEIHLYTLN